MTNQLKKGFGLLEVMLAAVVLAFLLVGLNIMQKGNRESIIRIRARDAANIIAQHVLDSLGTVGANSLVDEGDGFVYNKNLIYNFEGKPQLDKTLEGIKVEIPFNVKVKLLPEDADRFSVDSTYFTRAQRTDPDIFTDDEKKMFAKGLEATVSWNFKKAPQSITVAKVVR